MQKTYTLDQLKVMKAPELRALARSLSLNDGTNIEMLRQQIAQAQMGGQAPTSQKAGITVKPPIKSVATNGKHPASLEKPVIRNPLAAKAASTNPSDTKAPMQIKTPSIVPALPKKASADVENKWQDLIASEVKKSYTDLFSRLDSRVSKLEKLKLDDLKDQMNRLEAVVAQAQKEVGDYTRQIQAALKALGAAKAVAAEEEAQEAAEEETEEQEAASEDAEDGAIEEQEEVSEDEVQEADAPGEDEEDVTLTQEMVETGDLEKLKHYASQAAQNGFVYSGKEEEDELRSKLFAYVQSQGVDEDETEEEAEEAAAEEAEEAKERPTVKDISFIKKDEYVAVAVHGVLPEIDEGTFFYAQVLTAPKKGGTVKLLVRHPEGPQENFECEFPVTEIQDLQSNPEAWEKYMNELYANTPEE